MSKKLIAVTTGLMLGGALVVNYYTDSQYDSYLQENLEQAKALYESQGLIFSHDRTHGSMFDRKDVITVNVSQEFLNANNPGIFHQDLSVAVINECQILPLYLDCQITFDSDSAELTKLKGLVSGFDYQMNWQLNLWLNKNQGQLVTSNFAITPQPDSDFDSFSVNGLSINYHGDVMLDKLTLDGVWRGAAMVANNGGSYKLGGVEFSGELEKVAGIYLKGHSEFSFKDIQATDEFTDFTLDKMTLASGTQESGEDSLDLRYRLNIDHIFHHDKTAPNQKFNVRDVHFDLLAKQLTLDTLELLNQLSSLEDQREIIDVLVKLGQAPLTMEITRMGMTVNNVSLASKGQANLATFTEQDLNTPRAMVNKFVADLKVTLTSNLTEEFAVYEPMIEQFTQQNLLSVNDEGLYQSQLLIEQGLLKINGQPVQQLF